jgi:hypothetical protein
LLGFDESVYIVGEQTAAWFVRVVLGFWLKVLDFENLSDLVALFQGRHVATRRWPKYLSKTVGNPCDRKVFACTRRRI